MLPTLHKLHSVRREESLWYTTGHFNLILKSETLHIYSNQLQEGMSIPSWGQQKDPAAVAQYSVLNMSYDTE